MNFLLSAINNIFKTVLETTSLGHPYNTMVRFILAFAIALGGCGYLLHLLGMPAEKAAWFVYVAVGLIGLDFVILVIWFISYLLNPKMHKRKPKSHEDLIN
jgi:hypothetical protein